MSRPGSGKGAGVGAGVFGWTVGRAWIEAGTAEAKAAEAGAWFASGDGLAMSVGLASGAVGLVSVAGLDAGVWLKLAAGVLIAIVVLAAKVAATGPAGRDVLVAGAVPAVLAGLGFATTVGLATGVAEPAAG